METGRQRGKHMKLSLTKFLLDVSTKQEIQAKDKVLPWGLEYKEPTRRCLPKKHEKMLTSTHKITI